MAGHVVGKDDIGKIFNVDCKMFHGVEVNGKVMLVRRYSEHDICVAASEGETLYFVKWQGQGRHIKERYQPSAGYMHVKIHEDSRHYKRWLGATYGELDKALKATEDAGSERKV